MGNKGSKWLFILVGVAAVISVPILLKSKSVKHEEMDTIPVVNNVTGDTTADTLATMQAEVQTLQETSTDVITFNKELSGERVRNNALVKEVKDKQSSTANQITQLRQEAREERLSLEKLEREQQKLTQTLALLSRKGRNSDTGGIPTGFGFEDGELDPKMYSKGAWARPLDRSEEEAESSRFSILKSGKASTSAKTVTKVKEEDETVKMLTIADNMTGLDAVALTALVGRIPVKGVIPDPYTFKLIMGKKNIVANGLDIPELEGMIWSGVAKGDWNLRCVAGDLYSVTFVFEDGTIVTHDDGSAGGRIGWISDETGFPCVSGRFVSNAPQFLAQRAGLTGLGVASEAYAEAQRTTQASLLGSESYISGSTGKYVLGESISGATREVNNWLLERQQQSFDAVVVLSNAIVGIHVVEELNVDYKINGRRLRHEKALSHNTALLP